MQVVVRRTGLSADVLRVWERRYAAIEPRRSEGGRRLYTDEDVVRLQLLVRATRNGRSIGQVARLPTVALRSLVAEDEAALGAAPPAVPRPFTPAESEPVNHLSACLDAVRALDATALDQALARAGLALGRHRLVRDLLVPLLGSIGDSWRDGSLRIAHEHLASAVVRDVAAGLRRSAPVRPGAPALVVATPAGQAHELGALLVAIESEAAGFAVTYLGPNLPADEIAAAAATVSARVVALSLVYPPDDPHLPGELARLAQALAPGTVLLVGGRASRAYAEAIAAAGATRLEAMDDLADALDRART